MYVARILFPVKVLGPGNRIGIWFSGCDRRCPGCSNPELWKQHDRYKTDTETVLQLVNVIASHNQVDGFTLTGGDPLQQPDALRELLPRLNQINEDILLYTGCTYEDIFTSDADILDKIAVLIDGDYKKELNHASVLRGSDNQRIFFLKKKYKESYEKYMSIGTSEIQNFSIRDGIISVGIHRSGYDQSLSRKAGEKGLEEKT